MRYKTYEDKDEGNHGSSFDPKWQESIYVAWWDQASGLGGLHHWSHEPALGITNVWFGLICRNGLRYRRLAASITSPDSADASGFGARGSGWSHDFVPGGSIRIVARWPEAFADVELERFYPPTALFPASASPVIDLTAPDHFETAGFARGRVQLGNDRIDVDALCVRDHGWGYRDWGRNLNHRWLAGTFGPDLSFHSLVYHARDSSLLRAGFVVRHDQVIRAEHVDVIVYMEPDGLTNRGARICWALEDGSELALECHPIDAIVYEHHGKHSVQTLCQVEHEQGTGFCNLETTTNPTDGRGRVTLAINACNTEGLSWRKI